jgi:uncharacterized protein (DUF1330 family)
MTVYVIIHTTVDDTETHHREIVPKIMRAVERHGGKRIALGHGEQLRVHEGEPPNANRVVIHEYRPDASTRGSGRPRTPPAMPVSRIPRLCSGHA